MADVRTENEKVLMVMLNGTASARERARPIAPAGTPGKGERGAKASSSLLVPIVQPAGPHYFRLSELTRKPEVLQDTVADLIIRMPGLEPQPVILRLLISDEGLVDEVLIEDSFLAAEVEREIRKAFVKVRFEPGRIGRIAVRSQMRVEARLEAMERRLPG